MRKGRFAFVINRSKTVSKQLLENLRDFMSYPVESHRMTLYHNNTIVIIGNQTRQTITFTMNYPVNIKKRPGNYPCSSSVFDCIGNLLPEKFNIRICHIKRQYPDSNRSWLIMTNRKESLLIIVNFNDVPFNRFSTDIFNGPGKDPWMISSDRLLLAGFQYYLYPFH